MQASERLVLKRLDSHTTGGEILSADLETHVATVYTHGGGRVPDYAPLMAAAPELWSVAQAAMGAYEALRACMDPVHLRMVVPGLAREHARLREVLDALRAQGVQP